MVLPEIKLSDIEPFMFLKNKFHYKGKTTIHEGIAFTGRIRSNRPNELIKRGTGLRAHFVPCDIEINNISTSHNQKVFSEACKYIRKKPYGKHPFYEREINLNEKYQNRYIFHDRVIKKIFSVLSEVFGNYSISDFKKMEEELILNQNPKSFIDVACGENDLCERIAFKSNIDIIVGNDISFSQIDILIKRGAINQFNSVIYTNHDALNMPFMDNQFDIAICKNVLHHMPDYPSIKKIIAETVRISKRALIIEIMNPKYENKLGQLRHKYYIDFLKDAYVKFLSIREFDELLTKYHIEKRINCHTIRGIYMVALITKKDFNK